MTKAEINFIRSLAKKRERTDSGLFIAEGEKIAADIATGNYSLHSFFYTQNFDGINSLTRKFPKALHEQITTETMSRISALKTPTSVLCVLHQAKDAECSIGSGSVNALDSRYDSCFEDKSAIYLALDGVQDPGNMGTIVRLADWFGIRDIFCSPDTADIYNPKVIQATMGSFLRVNVHYVDLEGLLLRAKDFEVNIYTTALDGDNIYNSDIHPSGIIVMGNEGKGVTSAVQSLSTAKLLIPPYPADALTGESLNVAIATAIIVSKFRGVA